jgi:hypothetical protein
VLYEDREENFCLTFYIFLSEVTSFVVKQTFYLLALCVFAPCFSIFRFIWSNVEFLSHCGFILQITLCSDLMLAINFNLSYFPFFPFSTQQLQIVLERAQYLSQAMVRRAVNLTADNRNS